MTRPSDPVEFLGLWLQKYCENIEVHALYTHLVSSYPTLVFERPRHFSWRLDVRLPRRRQGAS